jgi:GntR family transcriptional regulator, rspAB operon transcriptional repressor
VKNRGPGARSLAGNIVEVLQREIISGRFRPGQRLVERELIRRFGVSSIPVREALLELEGRGLVTRRHNCGCSVIRLSSADASRICRLRRVLEPKTVEWAAERITRTGVGKLRAQLDRLATAAKAADLAGFFREDIVFHRMIWEAADNPYAVHALETMMGSLFASGLMGQRQDSPIDLAAEMAKHRRLFDAISEHDPQRAALALLEIAAGFEKHLPREDHI